MANATENRFVPSLGIRFFLSTALVLVLAIGSAVLATQWIGGRIAREAAARTVTSAAIAIETMQEQRLESLRLIARLFVGDVAFAAYVGEAIQDGDRLSLFDQLDERQQEFGSDFAIILDADGQLMAHTDVPEAASEDLSADPLVVEALDTFEASGVWARRGGLYHAVAVPITQADLLTAFLIAGYRMDEDNAGLLADISDTEIVLMSMAGEQPAAAASTIGDERAAQVTTAALDAAPWLRGEGDAVETPPFEVAIEGEPWLVQLSPYYGVDGISPIGAVASLASLAERTAPFTQLQTVLLGAGLGSALLGLLLSLFLSKRALGPLAKLATAARAAADGDYDQAIEVQRRDEVGQLAGAFGTLLSELREKRDMETYIAQLARTLPDEGNEMATVSAIPAATKPEDRMVALAGFEVREESRLLPQLDTTAPQSTLEIHTSATRRLASAVSAHGGRVEASVGGRLIASFAGERRLTQALATAGTVLTDPMAVGGPKPALVVVVGRAISGALVWDHGERPTLTGPAVDELQKLLRITKPGDLLVAKSAYGELAAVYDRAGDALEKADGFSVSLPVFALDATAAHDLTQFASQSTWVAPSGNQPTPTPQDTLAGFGPGSIVGTRFEVLSVLGSGGMGVVYKARDRKLDELVAVKMLKSTRVDDEQLARLKSELKLARKISHPNILRTFDFGDVDGIPFITMEYVRGITLRQLLDQSGRLPLTAGLRLARQLLKGLAVAHGEGVLHRDIKPENLIVEPNGNAKLMDFGIARSLRRVEGTGQTQPGAILGTPFYLAPEQIEGNEPDARADLYACGVVFYEIFTGALPFAEGGNVMKVLRRKLEEEPIPPRERWPEMPPALEAIILRCLARERDERYVDIASLLADLDTLRV